MTSGQVQQECSFLKKRTKKLLLFLRGVREKFFASFFRKDALVT